MRGTRNKVKFKMIRTLIIFTSIFFLLTLQVTAQEVRKVKINDLEKIIAESKDPLIIKNQIV